MIIAILVTKRKFIGEAGKGHIRCWGENALRSSKKMLLSVLLDRDKMLVELTH